MCFLEMLLKHSIFFIHQALCPLSVSPSSTAVGNGGIWKHLDCGTCWSHYVTTGTQNTHAETMAAVHFISNYTLGCISERLVLPWGEVCEYGVSILEEDHLPDEGRRNYDVRACVILGS